MVMLRVRARDRARARARGRGRGRGRGCVHLGREGHGLLGREGDRDEQLALGDAHQVALGEVELQRRARRVHGQAVLDLEVVVALVDHVEGGARLARGRGRARGRGMARVLGLGCWG